MHNYIKHMSVLLAISVGKNSLPQNERSLAVNVSLHRHISASLSAVDQHSATKTTVLIKMFFASRQLSFHFM